MLVYMSFVLYCVQNSFAFQYSILCCLWQATGTVFCCAYTHFSSFSTSYSIMLSYNVYSAYALSSYFEYPLLVTQDLVMLAVFLAFNGQLSPSIIVPAAAASYFAYSIASGVLPHALITTLVVSCKVMISILVCMINFTCIEVFFLSEKLL